MHDAVEARSLIRSPALVASVSGGAPPPQRRLPISNFLSLGAGEMLSRACAFAVAALLTRRLGAAGFGAVGFATAITTFLVLVPNLALQDLAMRAVAREPADAPRIAASVARVRLLAGIAAALAVTVLALAIPTSSTNKALVALTALVVLPQALNASWAYKALERTRRVGVGLVVVQLVSLLGAVTLVGGVDDIYWVPLSQAAGELVAALLLLPLVRQGWRGSSLAVGIAALRGAGTIILIRLLRTVIITADVVMLGFLSSAHEVGLYSAAYRVCFLLVAMAASAQVVFQPAMMRAHADPEKASSVLTDLVWMSGLLGFPLVIGGIAVAGDLLGLMFGEQFREGRDAFRILLVSIGLLFLHGGMSAAYLARNRLRLHMIVLAVAAAVNLLLNAIFITRFGIIGAATATLVSEAIILASGFVILWRWHWRPDLRVLWKPVFATAGMLGALLTMPPDWHVLARICLGGVCYLALLAALGGFPPQLVEGARARLRRD